MTSVLLLLLPKQLTDFTASVPLVVKLLPNETMTVVVPCPLTMLAFVGAVH